MTLADIERVLKTVLQEVYHYGCSKKPRPAKYIVWAEDGQTDASYSDNKMKIQAYGGTVDLFTREEFDPLFDAIQAAMNDAGMAWSWNSTQYEEDTNLIHHEWVWEIDRTL